MQHPSNTPGILALKQAASCIVAEGVAAVHARHAACASLCQQRLLAMGVELFINNEASRSPSVSVGVVGTAVIHVVDCQH